MQGSRRFGFTLLVLTLGCTAKAKQPTTADREAFYAMLPVSAQFNRPQVAVQILSDSVQLALDSAGVTGIDEVYSFWKRLWAGAELTGASRTVYATTFPNPKAIRDSGTIVFGRRNKPDTAMTFVATWRQEKAGWRLFVDSVRSRR